MPLGHLEHGEAGLRQQRLRLAVELLAVLQGAGGVIGDAALGAARAGRQAQLGHEL